MDKKVAVVTWFDNPNYGSVLQAYALQKVLQLMGYDSEFVDCAPDRHNISHKLFRLAKDVAILTFRPRTYRSRKTIYTFAKNNLHVSVPYQTFAQLTQEAEQRYMAAICGSDQIWSNNAGWVNPLYYLTFIDQNKRIAYAPSIGYNRMPEELGCTFAHYVNDIRFLSVRESEGAALIKHMTGRDARVVLDPSLLLTKEQWLQEADMEHKWEERDGYLLCYFRSSNPEYAQHAQRLADIIRVPVVSAGMEIPSLRGARNVTPDPFEFVNLVANASYILTDAFHGTAFSINLGKQFVVLKRFDDGDPMSQNSRIYNILRKTGLEGRIVSSNVLADRIVEEEINYQQAWRLLDAERIKSLGYLRDALSAVSDT